VKHDFALSSIEIFMTINCVIRHRCGTVWCNWGRTFITYTSSGCVVYLLL